MLLEQSAAIPCTACGYCLEGCPQQIAIPEIFEAMNLHLVSGQTEEGKAKYAQATAERGKAGDCIRCKKCEAVCPQQLGITEYLKQAAEMFE